MHQGLIIKRRKGLFQRQSAAAAATIQQKPETVVKQDDMAGLLHRQKRAAVLKWSLTSGRPLGQFH